MTRKREKKSRTHVGSGIHAETRKRIRNLGTCARSGICIGTRKRRRKSRTHARTRKRGRKSSPNPFVGGKQSSQLKALGVNMHIMDVHMTI